MSVTPSDWLNEARRCAENSEEISLRTAVSRGYYAGYHRARAGGESLVPEPAALAG